VSLYDLPSVAIDDGWDQLTLSLKDPAKPCVLVRLGGEFDASTSGGLLDQLSALVADTHVELTLDLSGVGFISASTIGVIVLLAEQFRNDKRIFNVVLPSAQARRVFAACGLTELPDPKEADSADSGRQRPATQGSWRGRMPRGHALGSWITVPVVRSEIEQSNSLPRAGLSHSHGEPLAGLFSADDSALDDFLLGTSPVRCGWS
jgi:anti-anti-sigma factor